VALVIASTSAEGASTTATLAPLTTSASQLARIDSSSTGSTRRLARGVRTTMFSGPSPNS
jgi:hypothetical protein